VSGDNDYHRGETGGPDAKRTRFPTAGPASAGNIPHRPPTGQRMLFPGIRVLAYHVVGHIDDPLLRNYSVTPEQFEAQLQALMGVGFSFVDAATLLDALDGVPVKKPSLLLTFDDAYAGLIEHAVPVLRRLGVPAVVFVVTDEIGGTNSWDVKNGVQSLPLLDAQMLHMLHQEGWEIGSHSRRHPYLPKLEGAALREELTASRTDLIALGLPAPRLLAYPHGGHDLRVRAFARAAGYSAAFGTREHRTHPTANARFAVPRIEPLRSHGPEALVNAVLGPPAASRRWTASREVRSLTLSAWTATSGHLRFRSSGA